MTQPTTPEARAEKLSAIRKKVVEPNPARICKRCHGRGTRTMNSDDACLACKGDGTMILRLADVLLALDATTPGYAYLGNILFEIADGTVMMGSSDKRMVWNLRLDALDDQDNACIDFLLSLLGS